LDDVFEASWKGEELVQNENDGVACPKQGKTFLFGAGADRCDVVHTGLKEFGELGEGEGV